MTAYYNEIDPHAATWLRKLIDAGLIAPGIVDERSIEDVRPEDLAGFTQCHFFAGIGGWSYALRLAMWPDDRPVWTGSCPCQPFSSAGQRAKQSDERHLWPAWYRLIREQRPPVIFGEQVASAVAAGWFDDLATSMEKENYACASAVLPACSFKPQRRDRLFFVSHDSCAEKGEFSKIRGGSGGEKEVEINWSQAHEPNALRNFLMLDNGLPGKMANRAVHGFGNAIVPQVAAEFITAYREAVNV